MWDGIPVTAPIRTLVDLAADSGPERDRAVGQRGRSAGSGRPGDAARARSDDYRGQRGVARLRAVLDPRRSSASPRSGLERRFLRLVGASRACRCRSPECGQRVRGRLLLARPRAGRRDRRPAIPPHAGPAGPRPASATRPTRSAGLTPLRFTDDQIDFEAPYVVDDASYRGPPPRRPRGRPRIWPAAPALPKLPVDARAAQDRPPPRGRPPRRVPERAGDDRDGRQGAADRPALGDRAAAARGHLLRAARRDPAARRRRAGAGRGRSAATASPSRS